MKTYIFQNMINNLIDNLEKENGYQISKTYVREEINEKNFEELKDKAFWLASAITEVRYELSNIKTALQILKDAEDRIDIK